MYQCPKCRKVTDAPHDKCPNCHILLAGIRCENCGHTGEPQAFVNNKHQCPACKVPVRLYAAPQRSSYAGWIILLIIIALVLAAVFLLEPLVFQ